MEMMMMTGDEVGDGWMMNADKDDGWGMNVCGADGG